MHASVRVKSEKNKIDMLNGPVFIRVVAFTVPLIISSVLQLLFNSADVVVLGRFAGDYSMAAVGCTTSLVHLFLNFFMGLSVGANVCVARYCGAGRKKDAGEAVHTAMGMALICGIILTLVGIFTSRKMLELMDTPENVIDLADLYLKIYFLAMTGVLIYNYGSAILRAIGDTKRPLYFLFIAGIINVILNLIFVICLKMDVMGVGLATLISEYISAVLVVICLIKEKSVVHLSIKKIRVHGDKLKEMLMVGLPAGLQGTVFALSNVVIQSSINIFGGIVVAGDSAAKNIEGFVYVSMNAVSQATISFVSQNYGAGNKERIKRIFFSSEGFVILIGLVLGNLAYIFASPLLSIYTQNPEAIKAGIVRMSVICTTYCLCGIMDVLVGALRGIGYSVIPMVVSLIGACGLRLVWIATVFRIERFHSPFTVYLSYPISWILTSLVHLITFIVLYKKLNFKTDKTKQEVLS